jgi:hypothetical protein
MAFVYMTIVFLSILCVALMGLTCYIYISNAKCCLERRRRAHRASRLADDQKTLLASTEFRKKIPELGQQPKKPAPRKPDPDFDEDELVLAPLCPALVSQFYHLSLSFTISLTHSFFHTSAHVFTPPF